MGSFNDPLVYQAGPCFLGQGPTSGPSIRTQFGPICVHPHGPKNVTVSIAAQAQKVKALFMAPPGKSPDSKFPQYIFLAKGMRPKSATELDFGEAALKFICIADVKL